MANAITPREAFAQGLAIQWTGYNWKEIEAYFNDNFTIIPMSSKALLVHGGYGTIYLDQGDWIWVDSDGYDSGCTEYMNNSGTVTGVPAGIWKREGTEIFVPSKQSYVTKQHKESLLCKLKNCLASVLAKVF